MTKQSDNNALFVKSHVARDLIQNAMFFKTEKLVVWEYVANGLEYIDEGTSPTVFVKVNSRNRSISIQDNGRGMDWNGLRNFFVMHGENIDRKQGKPGRGRFGTGKSAAFGIADVLRITTVHNFKRSKVELRRSDIEKISSGDYVPVQEIEREVNTTQKNGTLVEIENILLKSLDQSSIVKYIEHHLSRWPNANVYVNNNPCEFQEPPIWNEYKFEAENAKLNKHGRVELLIKVAKAPVDEDLRGISIYSNGIWHGTTMVGSENKDMSQLIFGEIDVPALDADNSPISPFDSSRSMQLNINNELVRILYAFIGQKIEEVRKQLIKMEKERKESEEARKLEKYAVEIEKYINEDFVSFKDQIIKLKARGGNGFDRGKTGSGNEDYEDTIFGDELSAELVDQFGSPGSTGGTKSGGSEPRKLNPEVKPVENQDRQGKASGGNGRNVNINRGGFRVEFSNYSPEDFRATYDTKSRTIFINLDHPQLVAAKGGKSVDDPFFRKFTFEIAFTEYAIALARELDNNDRLQDIPDAVYEVRTTIDRIARKAAIIFC